MKDMVLRVEPQHGPSLALIHADAINSSWHYRMPEGLQCEAGMFKSHALPLLDWEGPDADGSVWHEWESDEETLAANLADPMTKKLGVKFVMGIRFRTMITPCEHGLEIEFAATNLSDQTICNVTAFPCLGKPSEPFEDRELTRTFIETEGGITPLKDTDRGSGDPVRTHYHVKGCHPMDWYGAWFWGESGSTVATSGAILRTSADGKWTIGTNWERNAEIFQNEDDHHCIHSVPCVGDIAPGETAEVLGRIVFVEGDVNKAFELLRF